MRSNEYDMFGPWILEINAIDDIPRLFKPYFSKIDDVLLLIKIPKNIERRNANPSMDLYDYVLGVYDEYLLILKKHSKSVDVLKIKFKDIVAITNSNDLLNGNVILYLSKKIISFHYNAVSMDIIQHLLKLVREKYTKNNNLILEDVQDYNSVQGVDELYINLLHHFASAEDQFNVLAIQRSIKAIPSYTTITKRIIDFVNIYRENLLQSTMYLTNKRELLIISRGKTFGKPNTEVHRYDLTYISLSRITNTHYDNISEYKNISPFFIETQDHIFKYYFDNVNNQSKHLLEVLSNTNLVAKH